jgi:la-related protein 1
MENLIKDMYLRKHMDSQGFVLLSLVASFNRLKQLLEGDFELLKFVAQQSHNIEYRLCVDGKERIRKRHGWETFVLQDKSQRDEAARHDGVEVTPQRLPSHWSQGMGISHGGMSNPLSPQEPMSAFAMPSQSYYDFPRTIPGDMGNYSRYQMSPPTMNQPFQIPSGLEGQAIRSPPKLGEFPVNGSTTEHERDAVTDAQVDKLVVMNGTGQPQRQINGVQTNGVGTTHASDGSNGTSNGVLANGVAAQE